ncbi:MAG: hypothetical protein JXB49_26020 [Bacteroidales bacterium]|nr:hypothetical protein [Bacteroidales bacterium]MBN2745657.1 hypothetical protein [Bacteroidales bacterium]
MNRYKIFIILSLIVLSCNSNKVSEVSKNTAIDSDSKPISGTSLMLDERTKVDSIRSFFNINDSIKVLDFKYDSQWPYYVFVDYNRDSKLYEKLEKGFNIDFYSIEEIKDILTKSKMSTEDSISMILKTKYSTFIGSWICLYEIEEDLYVTNSCEPEGFYLLTDSVFYDGFNMDVPEMSFIRAVSQIDKNGFQILLESTNKKEMTLEFYKVDSAGTYLVALTDKMQMEFISYMTKVDSVRNYYLVHHECDALTDKVCFERINYQKIIKKYRRQ